MKVKRDSVESGFDKLPVRKVEFTSGCDAGWQEIAEEIGAVTIIAPGSAFRLAYRFGATVGLRRRNYVR